jgi:hypothetical protein
VEKFADILPKGQVRLIGDMDSEIKRSVTITPVEKYPFTITEVKARKGKDIKFELTEKESPAAGKTGYVLTVENLKKSEGRYFDTLILKTTSTIRPQISIRVFGDIRKKKEPAKPAS